MASPFKKSKDIGLDKVASLLDSDDKMSHNITMFLYLLTNPDVLLIQSCDMKKILNKMYWFTAHANQAINHLDNVIIFTPKL